MILGIHHTAISVPNIEDAVAFYSGVLGFEVVENVEWEKGSTPIDSMMALKDTSAKQRMLKAPNAYIELFEFASPQGQSQEERRPVCDHGYTHLCLQVSDASAEYDRLSDAGVQFHAPPQDMGPCVCTYGRDPFGNVIEIYEIKGDALPRLPGT